MLHSHSVVDGVVDAVVQAQTLTDRERLFKQPLLEDYFLKNADALVMHFRKSPASKKKKNEQDVFFMADWTMMIRFHGAKSLGSTTIKASAFSVVYIASSSPLEQSALQPSVL